MELEFRTAGNAGRENPGDAMDQLPRGYASVFLMRSYNAQVAHAKSLGPKSAMSILTVLKVKQ
jgi:hypothetical protein